MWLYDPTGCLDMWLYEPMGCLDMLLHDPMGCLDMWRNSADYRSTARPCIRRRSAVDKDKLTSQMLTIVERD
jgi:hypothetical protein